MLVLGPGTTAAQLTRRTQHYLDQLSREGHTLVSSTLLRTEVLCQANRQREIDIAEAERALSLINLVTLDDSDLEDAPSMPGQLRTLGAIHLTVAIRIGAGLMVAYDEELRRAAQVAGLRTGPEPPTTP